MPNPIAQIVQRLLSLTLDVLTNVLCLVCAVAACLPPWRWGVALRLCRQPTLGKARGEAVSELAVTVLSCVCLPHAVVAAASPLQWHALRKVLPLALCHSQDSDSYWCQLIPLAYAAAFDLACAPFCAVAMLVPSRNTRLAWRMLCEAARGGDVGYEGVCCDDEDDDGCSGGDFFASSMALNLSWVLLATAGLLDLLFLPLGAAVAAVSPWRWPYLRAARQRALLRDSVYIADGPTLSEEIGCNLSTQARLWGVVCRAAAALVVDVLTAPFLAV